MLPFAFNSIEFVLNILLIYLLISFIIKIRNRYIKIILLSLLFLIYIAAYYPEEEFLGNGFVYSEEHKHLLGKIDIPPNIISHDYDKHFIVVKQKPKAFNDIMYDKIEYVYPLGRDTVYYWLIIKQEQKVFGPLDSINFELLKKEYNVSEKLIL